MIDDWKTEYVVRYRLLYAGILAATVVYKRDGDVMALTDELFQLLDEHHERNWAEPEVESKPLRCR